MAFIGFRTPHETSRLLGDIDVPGEKVEQGHHHITLLFLGSGVPIEAIAEAVKATYAVTQRTKPFTVRTSRVTCFPVNPEDQDGYPIIARVESDALHDLREELAKSFNDAGVEFNQKFPDYKPHVTLAYSPEPVEDMRIPTIEWGAHEVVLWGGDNGDRKLTVTFPLALAPLDKTAARVAERYLTQK